LIKIVWFLSLFFFIGEQGKNARYHGVALAVKIIFS